MARSINQVKTSVYGVGCAVMLFMALPGDAFGFETTTPQGDTKAAIMPFSTAEGRVGIDPCLSYLNPTRFETDRQVMISDQRSAGQAAIGLVLGVQFALGPTEKSRGDGQRRSSASGFNIWTPRGDSGAQALAVSEYRRCKNKQTLEALAQ